MTYVPKPEYSNGQINKAGKTLRTAKPDSDEYREALAIVNEWRTCHAYPLNTFKSTLRKKAGKFSNALVAQRLKRLPTIIDKLERFETLKLTQMQDIGGIRAVVGNVKEVNKLHKQYADSGRFSHILVTEKNYIRNPKKDGYRGIHLVFRYHNTLARNSAAKDYEGLQIELQIRTQLQHTWATAVETIGTLKGESFKTGAGAKKWKEFLALVSSAFAIVENEPVLPAHAHFSPEELYKQIKKLEKELNFIENIRGLAAAAHIMDREGVGGYYNIIILDTVNHKIRIAPYKQNQLELASEQYSEMEATAEKGQDIVLVSAGKMKSLKQAYPNYFLDVRDFLEKVKVIIGSVK